MKKRMTNFDASLLANSVSYRNYIDRLIDLSIAVFEWINLPSTVDPRFLELTLFNDGQAIFFQDEVMGYLGLQVMLNGQFDVYRVPIQRRAFASNGYQKQLTPNDSVVIYNNYIRTNSLQLAKMYAYRLWDLDRTIEVNARAQKTPVLIQTSEQQRLTMLNLYKEYDGNAPVIYGDRGLDISGLKVLKTDAPYMCDKLYELKSQIWNEALMNIGIASVSNYKKERMTSEEVLSGQGGVIANRYSRLQARKDACDKINKMFGLNIDVKFRDEITEAIIVNSAVPSNGSEGVANE